MYFLKKLVSFNCVSLNDNKMLQLFNGVKSYLYGVSVGRVCKELLLVKIKKMKYKRWLTLIMLQEKMQ